MEIRQHVQDHFRLMLEKHKNGVLSDGPLGEEQLSVLTASKGLAEEPLDVFMAVAGQEGATALLTRFRALYGIPDDLPEATNRLIEAEIHKGYRSYLAAALEFNGGLNRYELDSVPVQPVAMDAKPTAPSVAAVNTSYKATVEQYLREGKRGNLWAAKTVLEKQDALDLLGEITGGKPPSEVTKADARDVKAVLFKLPKNRSKNPLTRDRTLTAMLEVVAVPTISTRTMNSYLSAFQSYFRWAVDNGLADVNVFVGTRVHLKSRSPQAGRSAFEAKQLSTLYRHLTLNPDGIVNKDDHKWPTLIAMFTGARLNEVAQLLASDVKQEGKVWCIDINENDGKKLKTSASRRLVPVHRQLIELGLLEFVRSRAKGQQARLFPSLTYSAQNGYGRNVGRWFNEKFLPALAMKEGSLVFHSLRHSMVTLLSQADVPDSMVKAIVGHEQVGVTHTSYFKSGFTLEQLQREINKFAF